jgi:hypothetical protein
MDVAQPVRLDDVDLLVLTLAEVRALESAVPGRAQ